MKFVSAGILALLLLAAMCEILREHLIEGTLEAIAERDRAKDLLEQKNAKMTEERLQEFLLSMGILAHEFRTPISALSLSNQYLGAQLRKGEFDIERLLKRLTSDAAILAKMNNHIDSSLVNVEVVHGRNAANDLEVVDMGDLVTKALDSNRDLFLKTGEVERHVVEDAFVRVDRVIIDQVVVNLVSNAIKANRARVTRLPGPQVVVSVEARDSEVVFKVSDQGVGISRENIEKMFTPFFSSGTPGHGLGLAMVKKAVTQMRGTVECRSELGRGTVFEVRFPRVHTTPAPLARRV
jgi:signal transduction histidine kinase